MTEFKTQFHDFIRDPVECKPGKQEQGQAFMSESFVFDGSLW